LIGENLVAVTDRLEDLARQVARLARRRDERDLPDDSDETHERPERRRYEVSTDQRAAGRAGSSPSRDESLRPVPNWLPETDPTLGENSISPQSPHTRDSTTPEPAPTLVPAPDLSGLETQLRQITEQLADLRQPCRIDDAVTALRSDLAEVSRAFNEAMPRQAIEVLEREVRGLAESVDRSLESGAEVAKFTQLERGLVEVRDTLRNLKPAEYFVEITQAVKHLAHRIDQVAAATQNPAALQKIDQAVAGLRTIVSHVASNDTVGKLAEEIRGLSSRFEHAIAENNAKTLSSFDRQITTLIEGSRGVSPELKTLIENSRGVSPELKTLIESSRAVSPELKALIASIGQQVNQNQAKPAQLSQSDKLALSSIEDRIVKLAGKLDDSDAWLTRLGTIERGIGDLLVYLEEQRKSALPETAHDRMNGESAATSATAAAAVAAAADTAEQALEGTSLPPQQAQFGAPTAAQFVPPQTTSFIPPLPTQAAPPETVVAESSSPNLAPNGASAHASTPSPVDALNEAIEAKAEPLLTRRPIIPDLPPDTPIEPSPEPLIQRSSAADRITASEAALGTAKPAAREVATQFETLIAARRAAFAAGAEASAANVTPFKPLLAEGAEQQPQKSRFGTYLRWVLVAISVIVIVLGAARVAVDFWPTSEPSGPAPSPAPASMPVPPSPPVAPDQTEPPAVVPDGVKNLPLPPMPMPAPQSAPEPPPQDLPANPPTNRQLPESAPNSPPNGSSPDPLGGDSSGGNKTMPEVTGALNRNADPTRTAVELPATIGGPTLRTAALGGNPAAEYEIAVRYMEGRGVTANIEEAAHWLERSARSGFAPAMFRLGGLYDKGGGLKRDRALARTLYTAAAEKGHAKAMHNLAVLYAEGFDGKPNYRLAAQWFRKAADFGIADSQYNLAILYIRGIGVEQNFAESYKWFALAAAPGDQEAAKKRDEVAERLEDPALNAAQVAVQTFRPVPQPEQAVGLRVPSGGWDRGTANAQPPQTEQPPAKFRAKPPGAERIPNTLLSPQPL
jgi:localization factor PodJL